jgi:hypothetical protein
MCHVRNLIVISVSMVLMTLPERATAFSWNPLAWFDAEPKKASAADSLRISVQKVCLQEATSFTHYARKNPFQIGAVGCMATAMGCMRYFAALQTSLQKNDVWALWKQDVASEQLKTKYDAQVTQELLHAIQVRYIKLYDIADFVGPIQSFMVDIDSEIEDLKRYNRYACWLQSIGLRRCVAAELYSSSHERIERLTALKVLCLHWLSKTKLELAFA